jgi:PAS domain S-box-containing protein
MQSQLKIARALTWRYVVALTLVATLTTAAWISLRLVIAEQESTAAIVNVSGRQRMLSQRTALFSTLLAGADAADRPLLRQRLREAVDLMHRSHLGLTRGDASMGLPATMSPTVRAMYFDPPRALDRLVTDYIGWVNVLLAAPDDDLRPDHPVLRQIIAASPTVLVASLDEMVSQYQREGEAAIDRLQIVETLVWLFTLVLLFLEATFIFKPFTDRMRAMIGELEKTGADLFESKEHLRIVAENANDWLWKTNAEGVITEFASRSHHLVSAGDAVGRKLDDLVDIKRLTNQGNEMFRAIEAGLSYRDLMIPVTTSPEVRIWVRASAVPCRAVYGKFLGYVGVWTDITENKRIEDELRVHQNQLKEQVELRTRDLDAKAQQLAASEERFRVISASSSDAMIMIDAAGAISHWNPAAERIFGYRVEEAIGRDVHTLLAPPRQHEDIVRGMSHFRADGEGPMVGKTVELMALRKNGEEFPIRLSVAAMILKGQYHAIGIARDLGAGNPADTPHSR